MRNNNRWVKVVGMLATGATLLQFGGCSLERLINQMQIGFARELGSIPAQVIYDRYVADALEGLLPDLGGGGDEDGA